MADLSALDDIDTGGGQEVKKKGVVDIIFLLDNTGSMGPAIRDVAKNITTFLNNLDPAIIKDWRVKIASFGDFETDSPELALNLGRPYTKDIQEIVDQITECVKLISQCGGGDEPESSLDALFLASRDCFDESWTDRTRAIILFTDATPKKITKETLGVDIDGIPLLSQQLVDNHTNVYLYGPKHDDYVELKNTSTPFVNYTAIDEDGSNPVDALKNTDFAEALKTLGKSISVASTVA